MKHRGSILWWGRSDPEYARNRILRKCLIAAGYRIVDFRPRIAAGGDLEAAFRIREPVDLVWVPCFRQRDVAAARRYSARRGVPLIFDPLISAYDKQIFERGKFSATGSRGRRLLSWERNIFRSANILLADTDAHAEFFHHTHGVPKDRIKVIPICADEQLFKPIDKARVPNALVEILFFASFIRLQGPQIVVEAANLYRGPPARWCLLGDGPLRAACQSEARQGAPIQFEDWLPYRELPSRIARADIVLGIFGDTAKSARVVPNKFCQALSCARPIVTRSSPAYPDALMAEEESGVIWVPPADARALSHAVARLAGSPQLLTELRSKALSTYRRYFSTDRVNEGLLTVVDSVLTEVAAQ